MRYVLFGQGIVTEITIYFSGQVEMKGDSFGSIKNLSNNDGDSDFLRLSRLEARSMWYGVMTPLETLTYYLRREWINKKTPLIPIFFNLWI